MKGDRVIIESPYGDENPDMVVHNVRYARLALFDSLNRGEAPIASHLLYTQVLDDRNPKERQQGIEAGLAWRAVSDLAVFYVDLGWSNGMKAARALYEREGRPFEMRRLYSESVEVEG